ncbi:MAG: DUF3108 domain-containing protein, partial [Ramlibacter sp.]|nr:DUF3108 domain-containing protein [Ramlibacter sp.]
MTAAPLRRLALLAGTVLAVHLALLGAAPVQQLLHPPVQATRTFTVRQVAAPAPAEMPAPVPSPAPTPRPVAATPRP